MDTNSFYTRRPNCVELICGEYYADLKTFQKLHDAFAPHKGKAELIEAYPWLISTTRRGWLFKLCSRWGDAQGRESAKNAAKALAGVFTGKTSKEWNEEINYPEYEESNIIITLTIENL